MASSVLAARAVAGEPEAGKGEVFESEWKRYRDPATDLVVYRLTEPSHTSALPAYYNRIVSRNSGFLVFSSDRGGSPQAFRMDLKSGETRQLTDRKDLDATSVNLTPDNRSFCYFADRTLYLGSLATMKEREIYTTPDEWERPAGLTVMADGAHALFTEQRGERSRLRTVDLLHGGGRDIIEAPASISDPIERPLRAQILYRVGNGLWLVNTDGKQNQELRLARGGAGPANWSPDGKTVLYLNFPEDRTQLNAIREYAPDAETDKLVAKTSQYVHLGFNRDTSVFVGASRNAASPVVLIMLRRTGRELTLCEHKASHPETVAPMFSPDAQRIYFQSDRDGKPALYAVHLERLVEKIEGEER